MNPMTLKEYAEHRGLVSSAVDRAIAEGRISTTNLTPDIHTPGVPRGHGAISAFSPDRVHEIVQGIHKKHDQQVGHLRGQLLAMATLLEKALPTLKNVEAEGVVLDNADDQEELQRLIRDSEAAVKALLTEHAMGVLHG